MSKLLINEQPLQVLPTLAGLIGLEESIALQQLHYRQKWIEAEQIEGYRVDGVFWVTASYSDWREKDFPFWNEAKIGRVFRALEALPFIQTAQHEAKSSDHTKSYRINRTAFREWEIQNCTIDDSKMNDHDDSKMNDLHIEEKLRESSPEGEEPKGKRQKQARLEDFFSELTRLPKPKRDTDAQRKAGATAWWNPLREILELYDYDLGRSEGLVRSAVLQMRQSERPLTIAAPRSIRNVALSIYASQTEGNYFSATITENEDGSINV